MKLTQEQIDELIHEGRRIMHPDDTEYEGYQTDQELKRPQPPLVKEPMRETSIPLFRHYCCGKDNQLIRYASRCYGDKNHSLYCRSDNWLLTLAIWAERVSR